MNPRLFAAQVLACVLALIPGCGKSDSSASPGASSGPGTAAASLSEDQVAAAIAELTQAVRKYAVEQRQAPKTLDELVAKGYLGGIPPAPKGKRYAINQNLQVFLANR